MLLNLHCANLKKLTYILSKSIRDNAEIPNKNGDNLGISLVEEQKNYTHFFDKRG